MNIRSKVFLFIITISSLQAITTKRTSEAIQYAANLTHFINDQQFGTFVCWMLQFSEQHVPALLHSAMAQELSKDETAVLVHVDLHTSYSASFPSANVAIIFADALDEDMDHAHFCSWLDAISYKTVVIVLFKMTNQMLINSVADNFLLYGILNLLMVSINQDRIFTFNYVPTRSMVHVGFPRPSVLLYNRLKELNLESLTISYAKSSYTYPDETGVEGEDIHLFKLFFQRLGIKLTFHKPICDGKDYIIDCLEQTNNYIFVNRIYARTYSIQLIDTIEMDKILILAPKSEPLSFSEMLVKPLSPVVWILLLTICAAVHLLCRLAPSLICNDLVLLALTGIEKRSLHTTGRFEKLLAISLIVLFFQLKSAYETKLVSYMIDVPTGPDPKTLDDLRERDLQVLVDGKFFTPNQFNEQLAGLTRPDNTATLLWDKAFLINGIGLRIMARNVANMDPVTGKQRFVPLEEILGERMSFFFFRKSCPFQHDFSKYRRLVFEAGLQQYWRETVIAHRDRRFKTLVAKLANISQQTVRGSTLKPLFICIIFLWVIALCAFLCELFIFYISKWYKLIKTQRLKGQ
uniref:Uncharacterized protein n=1 Tax=Anopheles gambiae TaxID=7165 RepID=A0A3F2YYS5_ANOGA